MADRNIIPGYPLAGPEDVKPQDHALAHIFVAAMRPMTDVEKFVFVGQFLATVRMVAVESLAKG